MFSYAVDVESPWQRGLIRCLDRVTGVRQLQSRYSQRGPLLDAGVNPWTTAVQLLDLNVCLSGGGVSSIPAGGPLVVVANHPYGVIDGMILCHLVAQVRDDFGILINSVMQQVEEVRPYLLPIDFRESRSAMLTNLQSRARAIRILKDGGAVVVFPAGAVSTAPRVRAKAVDSEWTTFTAKLVKMSKATVAPVYFHGQNSWLFQLASRYSQTIRVSLLARESQRRIGSDVRVSVGRSIPYPEMEHLHCREELTCFLRKRTEELADTVLERVSDPNSIVLATTSEVADPHLTAK